VLDRQHGEPRAERTRGGGDARDEPRKALLAVLEVSDQLDGAGSIATTSSSVKIRSPAKSGPNQRPTSSV
jgi:hypothetical protein